MTAFAGCISSSSAAEAINADIAIANQFGITGTPTFLVGRLQAGRVTVAERLEGTRSPAEFSAAIERTHAKPLLTGLNWRH
jgi:protein-disulfide isomerase